MSQTNSVADFDSLSGYRVLVVEDEYLIAEDLARTLRYLGATVIGPAPTVASARSLLNALRPHCVLLEISLRGENAIAFALWSQASGTPVLFVTSHDSQRLPAAAREIPLLRKPVRTADLVQSIRARVLALAVI